jgi:hypothetical protein
MLADPRLGIIVYVKPLHQLKVALHAQERVFVIGMKWRQEYARPQRAELIHKLLLVAKAVTQVN